MRHFKRIFILVVCFMFCLSAGIFTGDAEAEEPTKGILEGTEIEIGSDIAVFSKYIWRGIKLDGDSVIQSGIYLSGYGVEASIWGSTDIDSDDGLTSEEIDYTVGYTYSFDSIPLSLSGGLTYYDFPAGDAASREFYVGCSLGLFLSPSLTLYHDFGEEDSGGGDGDYLVLALNHSLALGETPVTLDLSGHAGYNRALFIRGEGGDIGLGAGLTIKLSQECSLSPSINYSIPFGALEDSDDGNYDDEFYGGATLAWSF